MINSTLQTPLILNSSSSVNQIMFQNSGTPYFSICGSYTGAGYGFYINNNTLNLLALTINTTSNAILSSQCTLDDGSGNMIVGADLSVTSLTSAIVWANSSHLLGDVSIGTSLSFNTTTGALNTIQAITTSSSPQFTNLKLTGLTDSMLIYSSATDVLTSASVSANLTFGVSATGQIDTIQAITTSSSPQFTNLKLTGLTDSMLIYSSATDVLTSASVSGNLTFGVSATGQIDTIQEIKTTSTPSFQGLSLTGGSSVYPLLLNSTGTSTAIKFEYAGSNIFNLVGAGSSEPKFFIYNQVGSATAFSINSSTNAVSTVNNVLEDGNGNMVLNSTGVTPLTVNTTDTGGNILQFSTAGTDTWKINAGVSSGASFRIVNNTGNVVGMELTGSTNALTSKNNVLDDGGTTGNATIHGNLIVGGLSSSDLVYSNSSSQLTSATVSANLSFSGGVLDTSQGIQTSSSPTFVGLTLSGNGLISGNLTVDNELTVQGYTTLTYSSSTVLYINSTGTDTQAVFQKSGTTLWSVGTDHATSPNFYFKDNSSSPVTCLNLQKGGAVTTKNNTLDDSTGTCIVGSLTISSMTTSLPLYTNTSGNVLQLVVGGGLSWSSGTLSSLVNNGFYYYCPNGSQVTSGGGNTDAIVLTITLYNTGFSRGASLITLSGPTGYYRFDGMIMYNPSAGGTVQVLLFKHNGSNCQQINYVAGFGTPTTQAFGFTLSLTSGDTVEAYWKSVTNGDELSSPLAGAPYTSQAYFQLQCFQLQ